MASVHNLTPEPGGGRDRLAALLAWEASVRRQASVPELLYFVANETRDIVGYDQLFVLKRALAGDGMRVETASSLVAVDRNAPAIRAIEAALPVESQTPMALEAPADEALEDYPFRQWLWRPLADRDGGVFGGLLFTGTHPFDEARQIRADRVAETAAHAWLALTANRPVRRLPKLSRRQRRIIVAACVIAALFPVRVSVLAPVEVVAATPAIITAPLSGVITSIDVAPNAQVVQGQALVRFDDVRLRNEVSLAAEKLEVARAEFNEVRSAAFSDASEGRGISIAEAQYRLAEAEYRYARDLLARANLTAPQAGTAIFTDRREWQGRAVDVGQPIMEIADPSRVRYRIDLPARAQLHLEPGSAVTVWLDSRPLSALSATLEDASFLARETPQGTLAYALDAAPAAGALPRIGSRGTARVRGGWAPLAYALLRRPIAGIRQTIGF